MFAFRPMVARVSVLGSVLFFSQACGDTGTKTIARPVVSVLSWVGYDEAGYADTLARAAGVELRFKTYGSGDEMYSLLSNAPAGTYDLVIVDAEYGKKAWDAGLLQSVTPDSTALEQFAPFFRDFAATKVGDSSFAVVVRWGALGLAYDTTVFSRGQVASYDVLFSKEARGRTVIFDWYLPNMGVMSKYLGNAQPYDLADEKFRQLEQKIAELKPFVGTVRPNTGDVLGDLASRRAALAPGVGEWAAAALQSRGQPYDWTVPREGGVMWIEAAAIPRGARHTVEARRVIQFMTRPEFQALLAWRNAYCSQVPNARAYDLMSADQRRMLHAASLDSLSQLAAGLSVRSLPVRQSETDWQRAWSRIR